jgi:hypothetical protein
VHRAVAAFVVAFRHLAAVTSASADLMWLDPDGRVTRVLEGHLVGITADGVDGIPDDAFVTGLALECSLHPDRTSDAGQVSPGAGFTMTYTCVLEGEGARLAPVDSSVTVTTTADVWTGPANRRNRDALATALEEWESRLGVPITEWFSPLRDRQVDRYGFRIDVEA